MVEGHAATQSERLRFLEIRATLDYSELEPGHRATEAIRKAAADLDFAGKYQARLRLTGPVPMADEEFSTVRENAGVNATVTIVIVLVILWLALRWVRIIFAVFVSLVVGLAITAAVGMLMVGTLNLISVYFAVLFVGLGVDFGIQFSVRYRAERHSVDDLRMALLEAGSRAGAPLTLAALATAAGFLSFLPTVYKGVSELGLIAGVGMLIAFATSITTLPALLAVLKPPAEPKQLGYAVLAPVDEFLARHRIAILIVTGLVVAGGLPLLHWLRFDFNPINLRSPKTEAVATYLELQDRSRQRHQRHSGAGAVAGRGRSARGETARPAAGVARSDPVELHPARPGQEASDHPGRGQDAAARAQSGGAGRAADRRAECQHDGFDRRRAEPARRQRHRTGRPAAKRLATQMTALAKADPAVRARAETVFVQPLKVALDDLRHLLSAQQVTLDNLPGVFEAWLGHARGTGARRYRPERRSQQQCQSAGLRARGADDRAGSDRGTDLDPGSAPHHRLGLHRGRRLRAVVDRHHLCGSRCAGSAT